MKFAAVMKEEWEALSSGHFPLALILLFLPLFYTVLFGLVYEQDTIKHTPLMIYDEDQSPLSRSLITCYNDSEKFRIVGYADSKEDLDEAIIRGDAMAGLMIPRDFSKNIRLGKGSTVGLVINSVNNTIGGNVQKNSYEIQKSFNVGVSRKLIQGLGILPEDAEHLSYPAKIALRILNNPTGGFTPFMLTGLAVQGVQIAMMITMAPLWSGKYVPGGPLPFPLVFLARMVPYMAMALLSYGLLLAGGCFLFGVPFKGSPWELLALGLGYVWNVAGVLSFLSSISPNRVLALQLPMIYIMPGTLLSGLSWPAFAMNEPSRLYAAIMPIRYTAVNVRNILLSGHSEALSGDLLVLALFGLAAGLLGMGVCLLKRRIWGGKGGALS